MWLNSLLTHKIVLVIPVKPVSSPIPSSSSSKCLPLEEQGAVGGVEISPDEVEINIMLEPVVIEVITQAEEESQTEQQDEKKPVDKKMEVKKVCLYSEI